MGLLCVGALAAAATARRGLAGRLRRQRWRQRRRESGRPEDHRGHARGADRDHVDAAVGDTIVVSLEANPTTGFTWKFTAGDTIEIVSSKYVPDPDSDEMAGAGGTEVVTVKVTKAGASDLTGTYRQQWNSPVAGRPARLLHDGAGEVAVDARRAGLPEVT